MSSSKRFMRVDTSQLKSQLFKKLGRVKSEKYFYNLKRLLSFTVSKVEFDKLCYSIVGRENLALHNLFIKSILSNACVAIRPPIKPAVTGNSGTTNVCSTGDIFTPSPQRGTSANSKNWQPAERASIVGRCNDTSLREPIKNSMVMQRSAEQQSFPDLVSIGSKPLLGFSTVEDGEEVEQFTVVANAEKRCPIKPPLGISLISGHYRRKPLHRGFAAGFQPLESGFLGTCGLSRELPDSVSLKRRLERRLADEGLILSADCANVLNRGLDIFLRRLIRPCMDLARARSKSRRMNHLDGNVSSYANAVQVSNYPHHGSLLDFRVALESNPLVLGNNWPTILEKVDLYLLDD